MAIHINITLHGGEVGQVLLQEHKEFYDALQYIADAEDDSGMHAIGASVANHAGKSGPQVVKFLRILAEEIEANG
jgi:hypothetical protein